MTDQERMCDGTNHRVVVDVVTFIQHVDEHFQYYVTGSKQDVATKIAEINSNKAPSADVWYDYCCDACKEVSNGNGS
jgi:hypothetical protein